MHWRSCFVAWIHFFYRWMSLYMHFTLAVSLCVAYELHQRMILYTDCGAGKVKTGPGPQDRDQYPFEWPVITRVFPYNVFIALLPYPLCKNWAVFAGTILWQVDAVSCPALRHQQQLSCIHLHTCSPTHSGVCQYYFHPGDPPLHARLAYNL